MGQAIYGEFSVLFALLCCEPKNCSEIIVYLKGKEFIKLGLLYKFRNVNSIPMVTTKKIKDTEKEMKRESTWYTRKKSIKHKRKLYWRN